MFEVKSLNVKALNWVPAGLLPDCRSGHRVHIHHAVLPVCGMSDIGPEEDRGAEGQLPPLPCDEDMVQRGLKSINSKVVQVTDGILEQGNGPLGHKGEKVTNYGSRVCQANETLQIAVVAITAATFSVCVYGTTLMEVDFDHKRTIPEGTYMR